MAKSGSDVKRRFSKIEKRSTGMCTWTHTNVLGHIHIHTQNVGVHLAAVCLV